MTEITGTISKVELSGTISKDELSGVGIFQDVLPVVTTAEISDITGTTASGGGNITFAGTFPVTAKGICWSTSQNPTIDNDKTEDGSGEGGFTSEITGLNGKTAYYARAYAISLAGISYGNQVSFETESLMDAGKGTFDVGTESWIVFGTNTIENDVGALKITYVDSKYGAYVQLREVKDLNTDLIVGKTYKLRARAKVNTGTANLNIITDGHNLSDVLTANYAWYEIIFVATHVSVNEFRCYGMGEGEIVWIDEWYIYEL